MTELQPLPWKTTVRKLFTTFLHGFIHEELLELRIFLKIVCVTVIDNKE